MAKRRHYFPSERVKRRRLIAQGEADLSRHTKTAEELSAYVQELQDAIVRGMGIPREYLGISVANMQGVKKLTLDSKVDDIPHYNDLSVAVPYDGPYPPVEQY